VPPVDARELRELFVQILLPLVPEAPAPNA
jgi:hypothetical protein